MIVGMQKKLLLITTGNIKNKDLFTLIRNNVDNIHDLFKTCDYVELSNGNIIGNEK